MGDSPRRRGKLVFGRRMALHDFWEMGVTIHCSREKPCGLSKFLVFIGKLFYSIAVSFDLYQFTMMDKAIDSGRSKGVVVVQDAAPISERSVGGNNDGSTFIPVRDDLKQEFGALLVHGEIA